MKSFLKRFISKKEESPSSIYQNIVKIITDNDEKVLEQVEKLTTNPEKFFTEYKEQYLERGIENFSELPIDEITWLGLADILIINNYVNEFDWKCEIEDFEYFFKKLSQFETKFSNCEFPSLNKNKDITEWIVELNKYFRKYNIVVANMDIDSDSYILFPIESNLTTKLQKEAEKINQDFYCFY